MAIDPSIVAGQAPQNPLQAIGSAVGLRGQMLQQQMMQQQMGANQATSQAMQQAYDPATGRIDTNKLAAIMSQDPKAAYNLLPTQNAILENQQKQLGIDTGQFDLALKRNNYLQGAMAPLANKANVTQQDFINVAADMVKNGLIPPDMAVKQLTGLPSDPQALQATAKQMFFQSQDAAGRLQMLMPQTGVLNNGQSNYFTSRDPMTGAVTINGQIANQMTPGEAASPVAGFDPRTNTPINMTTAQFAAQAQGQQPGQGMPGGNGRYPGNAPQGQAPGGMPPMGVPTGPALGAAGAAEVMGKGSAEDALNLQRQASGAPDRVRFLQDMTADLNHFESGPAADWTAKAGALVQQLAPGMAASVGIDPQSIASKESFTKFAAQLAQRSAQTLGGGTDAQLANAVAGNPHADLSKMGLQQIMQVLIGTERATQAKNLAFKQSGLPAQAYGDWEAKAWNSQVDPRVFVTPEMTQAQRAAMYDGLKPAEQQKFMDSYRTAIQAGIIQRPQQ
jgi:hypothetical protein